MRSTALPSRRKVVGYSKGKTIVVKQTAEYDKLVHVVSLEAKLGLHEALSSSSYLVYCYCVTGHVPW